MDEIVIVPQLGLSSDTVRLVEWLVSEGDLVEEGAPIAEVETDKATFTVSAPASGILSGVSAAPGQEVEVGAQLAVIGVDAAASAHPPSAAAEETAPASLHPPSAAPAGHAAARAFPAARRRADELGLQLEHVAASGPGGTVTLQDVEAAAAEPMTCASALEQLSAESWKIPQFWVERSLDLTRAATAVESRSADRLLGTLVDLLIAACGRALLAHPSLLAARPRQGVTIAYLVAGPSGLVAPALVAVDSRSASSIGAERRDLVYRALTGHLDAGDVRPADFSISNLGPAGIDRFMALVVPGQRAILALGRIRRDPSPGGSSWRVSAIVTADHRAASGADAAAFLAHLAESLEDAERLDDLRGGA